MNTIANSEKAAKALATTITRGITLLQDGYEIRTDNCINYRVGSPEGRIYIVTHNENHGQFHCTCEAFNALNCCKHLVCVNLNKRKIDAMNKEREEQERQEAARLAEEAKKPVETFVIVKAWSSWEAFWADCDLKKAN